MKLVTFSHFASMSIFHTTVQSLDKTGGLKSWIMGENLNGANKVTLWQQNTTDENKFNRLYTRTILNLKTLYTLHKRERSNIYAAGETHY